MRILRLVAGRVAFGVVTLFCVALLIFTCTSLLPGDAAQIALGQSATPETVAAMRTQLGLDQPAPARFVTWIGGIAHGELGLSYSNRLPVEKILGSRIGASATLFAVTALVAVPIAIALGLLCAIYRNTRLDRIIGVLTLSAVAVPEFLVATIAVLLLAVKLGWLPAMTLDIPHDSIVAFLKAFALPVLTLCCVLIAQMTRMTRVALIGQLDTPFVEMAVLKGLGRREVVLHHALPNALGPIANAVAMSLAYLLGGVIIIETIFSYPGLASVFVNAVSNRDLPVVQACVLLFASCYLVLLFVADLIGIFSNPKLRNAR
jgi:peptide/nickel transport system permease protein